MNSLFSIFFYTTAFFLILSASLAVISSKIMHSVFYSLICFILFGFLFFALNAPFNGTIQISIYGIALSILFAISIMLTNNNIEKDKFSIKSILAFIGIATIFTVINVFLKETMNYDYNFAQYINSSHILTGQDSIYQLSYELIVKNIFAFEMLGMYLLIALIGISVLLAHKGENK